MNKQALNSSGPMLPNTEHYVNHSAAHRVCWKLTNDMNKNEYVGHNPEVFWSWPFYQQLISSFCAMVPAVPPQIDTSGLILWDCKGIMTLFLTIVHAQDHFSTFLVWWWVNPDLRKKKKTGRNTSLSVWFVIFIGTFESSNSRYLDKRFVFGSLFIKYYILSEPLHLVGTTCFKNSLLLLKKNQKNQQQIKPKNQQDFRKFFFCRCCIFIASVWTLGHFCLLTYKTS